MAGNKTICRCNDVDYIQIRMAMVKGARTLEEIVQMTGACGEKQECNEEIQKILASVCGCKNVSLQSVLDAVRGGADTAEKVAEITGAGADCGRCRALVENIIELKR